jgi:multicomponent Na+:H+ antiporter subunit F
VRCVHGDTVSRLVGLEAAGSLVVWILLCLGEAYHRVPFVDLALTLALLTFGAGLVFARFLERWL